MHHGVFVGLLERRLVELHYRLAGAKDRSFDVRTGDAVVAFHKVQGMERVFVVREATWRRLARPRIPHPRRDWNAFHFEVDQTRQVLYTVEDGEITNVLHVSTGAGGATRDGTFRVHRKLAGFCAEPPLLSELLRRPPSAARLDRGADVCREPRVRPDPVLEREVGVRRSRTTARRVVIYH